MQSGCKDPTDVLVLPGHRVIWYADGRWNVLRDVCPHRLVPLSEGRIDEAGQMECGYHGWAFTGDGTCTKIPQGGDPANPRSCAVAYPNTEKQELLWVKLTPLARGSHVDTSNIPIIPEIEVCAELPQTLTHFILVPLTEPVEAERCTLVRTGRWRMGPASQLQHPSVGTQPML